MPKSTPPININVGEGTSSCQDNAKANLRTQVFIEQDAYDASQISAENPFETYLGDDAQSHFDDLASQVKSKPPRLGELSNSYSFGSLTSSHSGAPDWGNLLQADTPIWTRKSSIAFDGVTIADTASHFKVPAKDTFGYNLFDTVPANESKTDTLFNTADASLLGGGEPASFLCSIQKGSSAHQHARVVPRQDSADTFSALPELAPANEGFTVSGLLFPADRGTLALLRWENNNTANLTYTPASSVSDIESRVVASVNLSVGLEPTDNPIFIKGTDQFAFPSKMTGQYDLYEMQTGKKRADLVSGGTAIASLQANKSNSLGSVRILREPEACYFGEGVSTTSSKGNLPVLGGAYYWNGSWAEINRNFISYRMPMLASYEPSGIKTPTEERQRFFSILQPASTTGDLETAGNYITFGEDIYTFQVARFRHVVDYSELSPAVLETTSKKGSYALVHFKTEDAFENLVRDGIQPSEDDLWSVNFLNALEAENINNLAVDDDGYSDKGVPQVEPATESISNPLVRPQINVYERAITNWRDSNFFYNFNIQYPVPITSAFADTLFKREQGYYTVVSGVKYVLPKGSRPYRYQSPSNHPTKRNNVQVYVNFNNYTLSSFANPHYMIETQDTNVARKFNDPFSIYHLNLASLTGEANLSVYTDLETTPSLRTDQTKTQSFLANYQDDPSTISANVSSDVYDVKAEIYPEGDTGLCVISEGVLVGVSTKDPSYHYDGIATSSVSLPNQTGSGAITTQKVLYHSARLHSLIETATTKTVRIYFEYPTSANSSGRFFSIFRYDQEGFRIYQTLENLTSDISEVSSLNSTLSDYPKYGSSSSSSNSATANSPEATLEMVVGEDYFVEYGSNYTTMTNFHVLFITDEDATGAGSESTAISAKKTAQGSTNAFVQTWDRLGGGTIYGVNQVYVDSSTFLTSHTSTLRYPAFQPLAFNVNTFDLLEVEKSGTGLNYPQYGNFLETATGVVAVQGLSFNSTYTADLKFTNAYDPNESGAELYRKPFSGLFTARKDTQERFLDESYRLDHRFYEVVDSATNNNLMGAGMPEGFLPIELSVRDDSDISATEGISKHGKAGFLRNGLHWLAGIQSGSVGQEGYAQLRGMPQLANNVLSGGKYGQPRRGVLTAPSIDYTGSGFIPNESYQSSWATDNPLSTTYTAGVANKYYAQPDNSLTTSNLKERPFSFVRTFDVEFSRSGTTESMAGTSRFKLRLVGLEFNNIDFQNASRPLTVYVKVPGLTTWLDVGRNNGDGPSKQSLESDGAGCFISSQEGFFVEEAVHYLDLELEVGSNASFFVNSDNEVPVLVKAVLNYGSHAENTTGTTFGLDLFGTDNTPTNRPLRDRRGLIGIEILRMSNGQNFDNDEVIVL